MDKALRSASVGSRHSIVEKTPGANRPERTTVAPGRSPPPKVLALGKPQAAAYTSIAHVLVQLGTILYRDEKSFRSPAECTRFVHEHAYDLVLMPNPYGNEHRLQIYRALKGRGVPVITFDRGGLPRSWFFDVGFNADSPSYDPSLWDRPLAPHEEAHVRDYTEQVRTELEPLEAQGERLGADRLRAQLGIGDRKVLFVPFQRPSDTTVRYFSDPMRDFAEFERLVDGVGRLTANDMANWVVIAKKHPLETSRPACDVIFADDDTHINDLIDLADAVLVLNSGAGLISLCWDKPVLIAGTAYYADPRLNTRVRSPRDVTAALSRLPVVDRTTRDRFIHHLISSVYSFGTFHTERVRQADGSWRNITRRIDFDVLRLPHMRARASLLYVTSVIPWPIDRGAAQRTDQILSALCTQDLAIDVLCLNQSQAAATNDEIAERIRSRYPTLRSVSVERHPRLGQSMRLADLWRRVGYSAAHLRDALAGRSHTINCATHCPPSFARTIRTRLRQSGYTAVWFNYLRIMPPGLATKAKIICDLHDYQTARIHNDVLPGVPARRRTRFLERFKASESRALNQCDIAIAISPIEMALIMRELRPAPRMVCLPATDFPHAGQSEVHGGPEDEPCDMLFVGSRSDANIAGIIWFLENCFPRILSERPKARLRIHGTITGAPKLTRLLAERVFHANITFSAGSASMNQIYAASRFVICPILHGTGMKIRMIEALAYGKAIVATSKAAEGIATDLGLRLHDEPHAFAEACIKLLDDEAELRERERISAATFARDHHHATLIKKLAGLICDLRAGK